MNYWKIFEFISDPDLKKVIILDYKEVLTCMKRKAYKGAVVIAGGIVEAILINKALNLSKAGRQRIEKKYLELTRRAKKIKEMDLFYLIKSLENLKIITSTQASRSDILRDYRNLIHPFKQIERPTKSDSEQVKKLLDDLIVEFGKTGGLTAKDVNKAKLFLTHSKWRDRRERVEYKEILELFFNKSELSFEELLSLPSIHSKKNPSKSLIAFLNYLGECSICNYDLKSKKGYPIRRYEKWILNENMRDEVRKYLSL